MCLERGYHIKSEEKEFIKNLEVKEDGYIWLWKVFDLDKDDNLVAQFHDCSFYEGKNTAKGEKILELSGKASRYQYEPGFHCFEHKSQAHNWQGMSKITYHDIADNRVERGRIVVPIKVRKTWISSVGWQFGYRVIVCKHIII